MTQKTQDKNEAAEERSKDTRRFARQVRSATRRKYTAEEKIHIVLEGFRREVTVNELCRREGIKPNNFYSWTKEFMESGKHRLSRDTTRGDSLREHCSQEGKRGPEASGGRAIAGSSPSEKNVGAVSRRRRRQRMNVDEKAQVFQKVESSPGSKRKVLAEVGVSKSDCYRWRARQKQGRLEDRRHPIPSWFRESLGI
ncbi:MAG: transposase [Dehalococcoidia bacterium]